MPYSWSNDPTKSAIRAAASRQASDRGKQPINVFRCSVRAMANARIITASVISGDCRLSRIASSVTWGSPAAAAWAPWTAAFMPAAVRRIPQAILRSFFHG
jgi:hypothetical protein